MLSRLFSRRNRAVSEPRKFSDIEGLETRILFAKLPPNITGVLADNRGEVTIQFSRSVGGLSLNTVHFYTAGPDGKIGTKDDVGQSAAVDYSPSRAKLIIHGVVKANKGYRVRIDANAVADAAGRKLDGEFTGKLPTGNGTAGGNFAFVVKNDDSTAPIVRMQTSLGNIDIRMDKTHTPLSVQNFFNYANTGRYDNLFITRNIPGFIIQGGSVVLSSKDKIVETKTDAPVHNEFQAGVTEPVRGTIAFAKSSQPTPTAPDPVNSATNQWFFNLQDNSQTLDTQNGGFTPFGTIVNAGGLNVMDAIAGKPVVALFNPLTGHGEGPSNLTSTGLTNTPVNSTTGLTTKVEEVDQFSHEQEPVVFSGLKVRRDLITIRRVSVIDKIKPLV